MYDGVKTELTPKEFALPAYPARKKGIGLSRETILDVIWGYNFFEADRTVDWQIKLLRSKLGPYRSLIHTIRGTGNQFNE
ncbi:winged helix-turn-helix domain-containing protein [Galactobacillus timonensis]|uniref:winged helix-turn-helix domain-containing protein n=1 Tax=Galactobacillus timonensis TaxID=2041840 RepID=UPI000C83415E